MIKLETATHGTPRPVYYLAKSWSDKAHHRAVSAAVYRLAATIEEATMAAKEGWVVVPDVERARVYLELVEGTQAEAKRGMVLLHAVERA